MKTTNTLKFLRVAAQIGYYGSLIFIIGFIVLSIYYLMIPISKISDSLYVSDTKLSIKLLRENHLGILIIYYFISGLKAVLIVKIWQKAKNILNKIKTQKPFTLETASAIEKIAYLMIVSGLIDFLLQCYVVYINGYINNEIKLKFTPDLSYIFAVGIVYFISEIFKRG
ncbi:MAG: hypothetical protein MUF45_18775 [Spirosomaceae bacterium]|nr:hypothetical protein [Spirosomataceae bacterium]